MILTTGKIYAVLLLLDKFRIRKQMRGDLAVR